MRLLQKLKGLIAGIHTSEASEPRSLVIMQRKAHRFIERELQDAGERGWGRKFDGNDDPMFFVSADSPALTVVKAGPHIIRVTCFPGRYSDDDEYALSQLPKPEQKKAWNDHHAFVLLDLFNDFESRSIPDKGAYSSLAKLALHLGDPNCTAIFIPIKNVMMPNDGAAEEELRMLINKELPL